MMNAISVPEVSAGESEEPQASWCCRMALKTAAAVAGGLCFVLGIWSCISFKVVCIMAGIIQVLLGVLVLLFETPVCCSNFRYTQIFSTFASQQSHLRKAFIFAGIALVPVVMCFSATTVVGCGLVFAVGVMHGLMALGKKADRDTMLARAGSDKSSILPNIVSQPY